MSAVFGWNNGACNACCAPCSYVSICCQPRKCCKPCEPCNSSCCCNQDWERRRARCCRVKRDYFVCNAQWQFCGCTPTLWYNDIKRCPEECCECKPKKDHGCGCGCGCTKERPCDKCRERRD